MTETDKTAQRLHLYIHQLQGSLFAALEKDEVDSFEVIANHAHMLRKEMERIDESGLDAYAAFMRILMSEGARI